MTHYHSYVPVIENNDGVTEVCSECKHRLVTKKDKNGRIDNKKWLREHKRDVAQPRGISHKIFNQYHK